MSNPNGSKITTPTQTGGRGYAHSPYSSPNLQPSRDPPAFSPLHNDYMLPALLAGSGAANSTAVNHSMSHAAVEPRSPAAKKMICRHYEEGRCNRGSSCRFVHNGDKHRVVCTPRSPTQTRITAIADLQEIERRRQACGSSNCTPIQSPPFLASRPPQLMLPEAFLESSAASGAGGSEAAATPGPASGNVTRIMNDPYGLSRSNVMSPLTLL